MISTQNLQTKTYPLLAKETEIFYPESDGNPMAETDKHRTLITELIKTLQRHFENNPDVYVTGNIMVYYLEGNTNEAVSPDVMICFDVPKVDRNNYKIWEEQTPSVVIEIASRSTWKIDRVDKRLLYETLGITEFFVFNPQYPKKLPALFGFKLTSKGFYESLEINENWLLSQELNLELVDTGDTLRLFNPETKEFLPTTDEIFVKNQLLETRIAELEKMLLEK